MRHHRVVLVAVALTLFGVAACSHDKKDASAAAPAPVSGTSADTGTGAAPATEPAIQGKPEITKNPDGTLNRGGGRPATSEAALTAGGFGPYKIGVSQAGLASAGLIGKVSTASSANCQGYATATGLSKYHSPALVFYRGKLLHLTVSSADLATDKGVKVGTALANVKGQYPGGKQLDDWTGTSAWFATIGDFALLFPTRNGKVAAIQAGMAEPLQFKYTDNQGC
jgi:hypothetical protein